jgi:hypothetical protein
MKITIEIPDEMVKKIVRGIMDNFPEASSGCALVCMNFKYDELKFIFKDEDGKTYKINKGILIDTFPLIFTDKWPKGCTKPPTSANREDWDNWLCYADAMDFDAFVQLAIFGEVIYG